MKGPRSGGRSLALVFSLGLLALSVYGQEAAPAGVRAGLGSDGIQRIEVTAGDYYFEPNLIVLKVNVPAEIVIHKVGGTPHKIRMRSPEAGMKFSVCIRKKPRTIRFTPTKVGTYQFWCPMHFPFMKSHRARGMHGRIEVVE
jgi:plastocyanin domain-containing protein